MAFKRLFAKSEPFSPVGTVGTKRHYLLVLLFDHVLCRPLCPRLTQCRSVNDLILDPALQPYLALLKGLRNGVVYGAKVRAPHAFVMTFLFRSGS